MVSVAGPLAGQRAYESGIAGHKGDEIDARSLGSVKDIGQLFTDKVERWGEKSGAGPASGSFVSRIALVSNIPGMVLRVRTRPPVTGSSSENSAVFVASYGGLAHSYHPPE